MAAPSPFRPVETTFALKVVFCIALCAALFLPPIAVGLTVAPVLTDDFGGTVILLSLVVSAILLGGAPFVAGFIAWGWTADPRTLPGRHAFRILAWVIGSVVLVASMSLIGGALISDAISVTVAAAISIGSAGASAGSIWAGTLLRARDAAQTPQSSAHDFSNPANVRRIWSRIAWTFAITFLLSATIPGLLDVAIGDGVEVTVDRVLAPLSVAFLAAGSAGSIMLYPLYDQLQQLFHSDRGLQKRVTTTVLTGAPLLDPHEERVAAQYAALVTNSDPLRLSQGVLLFAGALLILAPNLAHSADGLLLFNVAAIILLTLTAMIGSFVELRRMRSARRYRDEHPLPRLDTVQPQPVDDTPEIGVNKKT